MSAEDPDTTVTTQPTPLPCIVCGVTPERVFPQDILPSSLRDEGPAQPYAATTFLSHGQYGSTVFDPQDESRLQINVCDPCLVAHPYRVWHSRYVRRPVQTVFSHPWTPHTAGEGEDPTPGTTQQAP